MYICINTFQNLEGLVGIVARMMCVYVGIELV